MGCQIFIKLASIHCLDKPKSCLDFGDHDFIFKVNTGQIVSDFSQLKFVGRICRKRVVRFSSNL